MSLAARVLNKGRRIVQTKVRPYRRPLAVGIVGCGQISEDHAWGYELTGLAVLTAVSDVSPAALARTLNQWGGAKGFVDYRAMLREARPAAISVCTWPQTHAEIVAAAADAGVRAVLCEKPMALTGADLRRVAETVSRTGIKLAGGHQYRFHPYFVRAAAMVRAKELGAVIRVSGYIRSSLANNGPHLVDTVRFLLGDPAAREVTCSVARERDEFNRGLPCETSAQGEVIFDGGVPFALVTGDIAPDFFGVTIECERGVIDVTPKVLKVNGKSAGADANPSDACRSAQFAEFVAWARNGRRDYAAGHVPSIDSASLVLALYEAARQRGPIVPADVALEDPIADLFRDVPRPAAVPPPAPLAATDGSPRLALHGGPRAVGSWFSTHPAVGLKEWLALGRVVMSKQLGSNDGNVVRTLEEEFADAYGAPAAVASTSGTSAIHVALGALDLEPGDEVITTPMTDMGSVIPILACNCVPVFADVDPVTGNMTPDTIAAKITPRTRAIILVHLFGRPADIAGVAAVAAARGIALIEDCAQAHFAEYGGRKVGTFGDFGCFSLQQSKQITCGDGGLTLVNRAEYRHRAAMFVDKGWDRALGTRSHLFLGMNYRMTELQGAVARVQLQRLPELVASRRRTAEQLTRSLAGVPGLLPIVDAPDVKPAWWKFLFSADEAALGVPLDTFADGLMVEGMRVVREYLPRPLFDYEVVRDQRTYGTSGYPLRQYGFTQPTLADFPGYREFCRRMLLMSWSHDVSDAHVTAMAAAVAKVADACRARAASRPAADRPQAAGVAVAR
jgi:dTDP-4-amino-4,6-dideoxygalactose transaminase/predicted dehydrogenase